MFKRIVNFLSTLQTIHLILLPVAISLLPLAVFGVLGSAGYRGTPLQGLLLLLVIFLWGLMGVPMIIRKEVPWLMAIRGSLAVVQGIVIMLLSWAIILLWAGVIFRGR